MKKNKFKINSKLCTIFSIFMLAVCVLYLYKTNSNLLVANYVSQSKMPYNFTDAFKEVAYSYYMRGEKIQYNGSKIIKYVPPEYSTSQNSNYTVCDGFATAIYKELVGITIPWSPLLFDYARQYIGIRAEVVGYGQTYVSVDSDGKETTKLSWCNSNVRNTDSEVASSSKLKWREEYNTCYKEYHDKIKESNPELDCYENYYNLDYDTQEACYESFKNTDYGTFLNSLNSCVKKDRVVCYDNPSTDDILKLLQPGDIIKYYGGHTVLVYDLIKDESGQTIDAYIMHAYRDSLISSRIKDDAEKLIYDLHKSNYVEVNTSHKLNKVKNETLKNPMIEGSIRLTTLKNYEDDGYGGAFSFNKERYQRYYVILRFLRDDENDLKLNYYRWENGKAVDSIDESVELPESTKGRVKYSKLYIEKTVDKFAENVVSENETITYKILIKNNSELDYLDTLNVTEKISEYVTYENKPNSYEFTSTNSQNSVQFNFDKNNTLTWTINHPLKAGETVIIEYKVKVKNGNIGKIIKSTGTVGNIPSGKIENLIGVSLTDVGVDVSAIKTKYNELKHIYNGAELIDEIYKSTTGTSINFKNFDFNNLLKKEKNEFTRELNDSSLYKKYILNSSVNFLTGGNNLIKWLYDENKDYLYRNEDTIYKEKFKTGDILFYRVNQPKITKEQGDYAYIYIDGEGFVGINLGADGIINTNDDRNKFSSDYYKNKSLTLYTYNQYKNNVRNIIQLSGSEDEEELNVGKTNEDIFEFSNYQTLFEKDFYVVFRPSLVMRKIIYELNEGTNDSSNPNLYIIDGENIELKDATKEGYIFNGWYKEPEFQNKIINTEGLNENIILYAKWTPITYNIKYNSNGGIGNMENQSMTYNTPKALIPNTFTRTGYKFKEWNTQIDGKGTSYKDKSNVLNLTEKNGAIVNLYAIWEKDSLDIKSEKYSLDLDKKIIGKISERTLVSEFEKQITLSEEYTISIESKIIDKNEYIYTGSKTKIYKNGKLYDELTNIVLGDTTGDGIVNISDVSKLYRFLKRKIEMDGIYIQAGNVVSTDDKIGINDVSKLYRYLKRKIDSLR